MSQRRFSVRALGEIAIRCIDLEAMVEFYRDVVGLKSMNDPKNGDFVFLRIAEGFADHTQVLALFRNDVEGAGNTRAGDEPPATGPGSSLHRRALNFLWGASHGVRRRRGNIMLRGSLGLADAGDPPRIRTATLLNSSRNTRKPKPKGAHDVKISNDWIR
ncbi:hypothetical protein [Pacificibacter marinus]|uniref:hypothetical protein n=1 Tax=Pacificibacter marinus TaxID=658057 RepID=UPI0020919248|nr:hypothetical protein [Pacificibacter marinus]